MRGKRYLVLSLLAVALAACGKNTATVVDQTLASDLDYGARGVAVAPPADDPAGGEIPFTLVVEEGRALIAGYGCRIADSDCSVYDNWLAAAWKFDAAGRPDTDFASGGVFTSANPAGGSQLSAIFDAEATPGGFRMAGVALNANPDLEGILWALKPDGTLDPTLYGGAPLVVSDWAGAGNHDYVHALRTEAGFTWLAGGVKGGLGYDAAVWKVKDDGTPDTGFDGDGVWVYAAHAEDDWANDLAVDGSGDLWLVGTLMDSGKALPAAWKLAPGGGLVADFGQGGLAMLPLLGSSQGRAMKIVFDEDRAVVAGCVTDHLAVWRIGADGAPDEDFGTDGTVLLPEQAPCNTFQYPVDLAVDGEGRYWLAGGVTSDRGDLDMAVWRLLPDGSPDPHFCGGAACAFDNAAGGFGDDWGAAIALEQEDIFVAGWSWSGARQTAVVWKLNLVDATP